MREIESELFHNIQRGAGLAAPILQKSYNKNVMRFAIIYIGQLLLLLETLFDKFVRLKHNNPVYFRPILSYPFGSTMAERGKSFGDGYKFGFNTQEKEPELGQDVYTAEFWMYSAQLGRRWNVDPVVKNGKTPFEVNSNKPITNSDPNGDCDDCKYSLTAKVGFTLGTDNKRITTSVSGSIGNKVGSVSFNLAISKDYKLYNQSAGVGYTFSGTASGTVNVNKNISLSYSHNTTRFTGHFSNLGNSVTRIGIEFGSADGSIRAGGGWLNDNDILKFKLTEGTDGGRITNGFDYGIKVNDFSISYTGLMNTADRIFTGSRDKDKKKTFEKDELNPEKGEFGTYRTDNLQNSFHHYQMFHIGIGGSNYYSPKARMSVGIDNMKDGQKVQNFAHQGPTNRRSGDFWNGVGVPVFNWSAQPGYSKKRFVTEINYSPLTTFGF